MDQNPPKEVRSPVNLRIKFRSESLEQFIERYAVDVSRGGIFIRTREPLAVGTQLKLDFQYQNGGPLMAGDGTVVWIRDPDPSRPNIPPGMGVRFDRLSPESQAVLELLLADKVKREKSGLGPATVSPITGSAGIAVRRPSSMFAALEPQGPGAGPRAAAFTSQLPVTGAMLPTAPPPPKGGPVTSILIVPSEAKALGSVSPAGPSPASPPSNAHLAETPATGIAAMKPLASLGAPDSTGGGESAPGGAGYRPLGTTKNPFSGLQKLAPAPPAARLTSTISTTGKTLGGGPLLPREPQPAGRHDAAPDDDINEEPTQIAGRVPSFLMTDDDPTSVGNRPSQEQPTQTANQAALLADLNRITARATGQKPVSAAPPPDTHADTTEMTAPPVPGYTPPRAVPGPERFNGSAHEPASDLAARQQKQSLDLAPPLGDQPPQPAKAPERTTDAMLDPEAAPLATSGKVAVSRRNLDALSLAAAATDVRAQAPRKRSGLVVALAVLVLGGAGAFAFKYFSAHHATPAPAPAGESATAIAPAPAPPAAPAAPAGEQAAAPAQAPEGNKPPQAAPAPGAPPATEPAAAAPPAVVPAAPAPEPAAAKEPEAAPAVAPAPSKPVAMAEPAGSHKGPNKKKGGRSGHESEAASSSAKAVAAGVPDTLPPSEAPAAPKAADKGGDGAGHQLRVTSKPSGADVSLDGQVIGQTPLAAGIADVSAPHFVSVHKDGYEPFEQMISASSAWAKGKPAKGQPAVPTLKLNAKLKAIGPGGDAKPAASAETAPAKEAAKEAAAEKPAAPAATAPTSPPKVEETKVDRPLPPSDDRLPPSTP